MTDSKEKDVEENVIEVRGFEPHTTKDALICHFENPRKGGGDVTDFQRYDDEGVIFITFADADIARNVAGETHTVGSCVLKVKISTSPPHPMPPAATYSDRLRISGIKHGTGKDRLLKHLGEITQRDVKDEHVKYTGSGTAVVVFEEMPDLVKLQEECTRSLLDNSILTISRLALSDSIIVRGLRVDTSEVTVSDYFEGRRSGNTHGTAVKNVTDYVEGHRLVYFRDHAVVDDIVASGKGHTLDGSTLDVSIHYVCLTAEADLCPSSFEMSNLVEIPNLAKHKIKFIKEFQSSFDILKNQLEGCKADLTFSESDNCTVILTCTLTTDSDDSQIRPGTWATEARRIVYEYFRSLELETINISPDIWDEVVKHLDVSQKEEARLFVDKDCYSVIVVGHAQDTQHMVKEVRSVVKNFEDKFKKVLSTRVETMKLRFLQAKGFPKLIQTTYPRMEVHINVQKGEIVFEGYEGDINQAALTMYEMIHNFKTSSLTLSETRLQMVSTKCGRDHIDKKLKKDNIVGVWQVTGITTMATSDTTANDIAQVIAKSVVEKTKDILPETADLLTSPNWTKFVTDLSAKYGEGVNIIHEDGSNCLTIVALDDVIEAASGEIDAYFENNAILNKTVKFSPGVQHFLQKHYNKEIDEVTTDLKQHDVQIQIQNTSTGSVFNITATKAGLDLATKRLNELASNVKQKKHAHRGPGIGKLFQSRLIFPILDDTESKQRCVIELGVGHTEKFTEENRRTSKNMTSTDADGQSSIKEDTERNRHEKREITSTDADAQSDGKKFTEGFSPARKDMTSSTSSDVKIDMKDANATVEASGGSNDLLKEDSDKVEDEIPVFAERPIRKERTFDNPFTESACCDVMELCDQSRDTDSLSEASLTYFFDTQTNVEQCIQSVQRYYDKQMVRKIIEDKILKSLNSEKIKSLEKDHHVTVTYERDGDSLHICGLQQDVSNVSDVIQEMIRNRLKQKMTEIASHQAQWYFEDTDVQGQVTLMKYDKDVNGVIEEAYGDGSSTVVLKAGFYNYVIDFHNMKEYLESDQSDCVPVKRNDLIKVEEMGFTEPDVMTAGAHSLDHSGEIRRSTQAGYLPNVEEMGITEPDEMTAGAHSLDHSGEIRRSTQAGYLSNDSNPGFEKVRDNYTFLLDSIDGRDLTPTMFEKKVFDQDTMAEINSIKTREPGTKRFMEILITKLKYDDNGTVFSAFLLALSRKNYETVQKKLKDP